MQIRYMGSELAEPEPGVCMKGKSGVIVIGDSLLMEMQVAI